MIILKKIKIGERRMWIFEPTARLKDFDQVPGLKEAWSKNIENMYELNLYGYPNDDELSALEELRSNGGSDIDLRVYNPASMLIPTGSTIKNVTWSALPTSFDEMFNNTRQKFDYLDNPQSFGRWPSTRIQDEYCEWVVKRKNNKIISVIFTSEPPEYYQFLFEHSDESRELLLKIYQEITGIATIKRQDLMDSSGQYNWWNKYNNEYAIHMQQPNNTLGAQINIVSRSSILRHDAFNRPTTDALGLIKCGEYGDKNRQSDPNIGHAINTFARQNRYITVENPVGLYMSGVNWSGWTSPDGENPNLFWKVIRGTQLQDPNLSYIVRAVYEVPSSKNYTVSDIKIGGQPIEFGAQIAAKINVRVGVLVSQPMDLRPPRSIGCLNRSMALSLSSSLKSDMNSRNKLIEYRTRT